uniref:hypothetical protein n=1 Tax=Actinoplanes sp. CA-084688 TaxID=3239901 RepID=UPI003F49739B
MIDYLCLGVHHCEGAGGESLNIDTSSDAPSPARGRGAPTRPVGDKMRVASDPVVALAECVQALVHERFSSRHWAQLVACLSDAERDSLGGGDNRYLSRKLSGQFGAKSRRGPTAATIRVVLTHCLPAVTPNAQPARRAEILERFQAVHGPSASLTTPVAPRPRRAPLSLRQLQDDNQVLRTELATLTAELKAAQARLALREIERAATALAAPPRPVGIIPALDLIEEPALVRPYAYARGLQEIDLPPGADHPGLPPGPPPPALLPENPDPADEPVSDNTEPPPPLRLAQSYRIANTPRTFPPLPQYRPELQDTAPSVPLQVPRQRVMGRAQVPPEFRATPPLPREPRALWQVVAWPRWQPVAPASDEQEETPPRRRAADRRAWLIPNLWVDPWADLAPDRMLDDVRGWRQIPLLITATTLAALMSAVPPLLG